VLTLDLDCMHMASGCKDEKQIMYLLNTKCKQHICPVFTLKLWLQDKLSSYRDSFAGFSLFERYHSLQIMDLKSNAFQMS